MNTSKKLGFTGARAVLALAMVVLATTSGITADPGPWQLLDRGLELAEFTIDDGTLTVLRIDPAHWETIALAASEHGDGNHSVQQWCRDHGLTAGINAGMYAADLSTHTGYFHIGKHVNNGVWNQRDYRQAACFEPRRPELPRFVLHDLDAVPESTFVHDYGIVVQNLRLIRRPGENRWPPRPKRWAEACLAEDDQGRMLWIHCPVPRSMHQFNEAVLALPLNLVAAQHLEGGSQAQLWVAPADLEAGGAWPVPNVLGIRSRVSD